MGSPERRGMPQEKREIKGVEIEHVKLLRGSDVTRDDRVLITTESGNRYMIRYSESKPGKLKIHNEKNGFKDGQFLADDKARPLSLDAVIAEVGKPILYNTYHDSDKSFHPGGASSRVTEIEIRRGLEKLIREGAPEVTMGGLAQMLIKAVNGRGEM